MCESWAKTSCHGRGAGAPGGGFRDYRFAGNVAAKHGTIGVLKRLLPRLRQAFPGARLRIRLDAGFTGPQLYAFFEAQKLDYVVGIAKNAWLKSLAEPLMAEVRSDFEAAQETTRRYGECAYQAGSWPHERRAIFKAEVTAHIGRQPKDNPRFVVTNLKTTPQHVYEDVYCARGDVENRLKELGLGLEIDRTSCTRFLANQLRVLMSAAAYVLMQELRLKARRTGCGRAQVSTLRLRLLKLGAWIESSLRRIVIHLPIGTPFGDDWRRIARDDHGRLRFRFRIDLRAHAAVGHPVRRDLAVIVSRRPGNLLYEIDLNVGEIRQVVRTGDDRHFYGHAVYSPDGRYLFTTENDFERGVGGGVRDGTTLSWIREMPTHGIGPHVLALLGDGPIVLAEAPDALLRSLNHYTGSICLHPDTGTAEVSHRRGGQVTFWNSASARFLSSLPIRDAAGISLSADGERFVVSNGLGEIHSIRADTLKPAATPVTIADTMWDNHLTLVPSA